MRMRKMAIAHIQTIDLPQTTTNNNNNHYHSNKNRTLQTGDLREATEHEHKRKYRQKKADICKPASMWINLLRFGATCTVGPGELMKQVEQSTSSNRPTDANMNKWPKSHQRNLVKKQRKPLAGAHKKATWLPSFARPCSGAAILINLLVLLILLIGVCQLAESKTHHSKRQVAPSDQQQSGTGGGNQVQPTGRENTNWWNLWWQQYINEAVQPTVRPIVSVSFNGRTINLSPSEQADLAGSSNSLLPMSVAANSNRDLETNFVPTTATTTTNNNNNNNINNNNNNNQDQDIERNNEKLRLIATNLPDNAHPFAAKQMMLAQRKSNQQQANWQSVKPTIIQMSPSSRGEPARSNRQAAMFQSAAEPSSPGDGAFNNMGIQMRASMSRANQQQQQQQVAASGRIWPEQRQQGGFVVGSNMIQQQLSLDDLAGAGRFEQQQHQMVDYSEEPEPELDNSTNPAGSSSPSASAGAAAAADESGDQGRGTGSGSAKDSSTSSMMMAEPQRERDMVTQAGGQAATGRPQVSASDGQQQQQPRTQLNTVGKGEPGRAQQQQPFGGSTKQPSTTAAGTTPAAGQVRTGTPARGQQQPQQVSTAAPEVVSTTLASATTSTMNELGTGRTQEEQTKTTTTSTTTTGRSSSTADPNDPEMLFTETPISFGGAASSSTSAPGRVELENGRPATGSRQQASTNSARPAKSGTSSATTPSRGFTPDSSVAATSSSAQPGGVISAGQGRNQQAAAAAAMTTTTQTTPPTPSNAGRQRSDTTSSTSPLPATTLQTRQPGAGKTETTGSSSSSSMSVQPESTTTTTKQPTSAQTDMIELNKVNMDDRTSTTGNPPNSTETGDDSSDSDSDSDSDEADSADGNQPGAGINNANGSDTSDGDSDSDQDESDQEGDKADEGFTTTTTTTTTASPNRMATTKQVSVTTQQPSLTTIDIERLPKSSSPSPIQAMNMVMRGAGSSGGQSRATSQTANAPATSDGQQDEFARLRQPTREQQADGATRLVMMNLGEPTRISSGTGGVMEGDNMAITLPMDTLVRMMMGQMKQVISTTRLPAEEERPITSTVSPKEQTTTTTSGIITQQPAISSSSTTSQQSRTSELNQVELTTTQQPETSPASQDAATNQQQPAKPVAGTSGGKKKLQPPPTTRSPGTSRQNVIPQQQPMSVPAQTSFIQEGSQSPTTGGAVGVSQQPQLEADLVPSNAPKMMFVNLDATQAGSADENPSSMAGTGGGTNGREPKIELLNLDLMPIQRIMNSQQMKPFMRLSNEGNNNQASSSKQPTTGEQQQQRATTAGSGKMTNPNQVRANETRREPTMAAGNKGEFVLEVEPGMRLRPVATGSKTTTSQMQAGRGPVNANQANTVYMVVMDTPAPVKPSPTTTTTTTTTTTVNGRKQVSLMTTSTLAPSSNQQRAQTKAQQLQLEPQVTTTSKASTTPRSSKTTSSMQQQQRGFNNEQPTTSQMQVSRATSTPAANLQQQQQQTKSSPRGSSQVANISDQQRQPTTPLPDASTTAAGAPNKPKFIMMSNTAVEEREKDAVPSMREIEMSLEQGQRQQVGASGQVDLMDAMTPLRTSVQPASATSGEQQSQTTASSFASRAPSSQATTSSASSSTSTGTTLRPTGGDVAAVDGTASSAGETSQPTTTQSPPTSQRSQTTGDQQQQQQQQQQRQQQVSMAARPNDQLVSGEKSTTSAVPGQSGNQAANQSQMERIQQAGGEQRPQRPPGIKSSKIGKPNNGGNLTSSFIPTKLRSDFSKLNRIQPQQNINNNNNDKSLRLVDDSRTNTADTTAITTTQSPAMQQVGNIMQNMAALRQFGGANRMSALANQPVPFGRPSMGQPGRSNGRIELPSFEYGPSIAVRRPDEPLANGQVPNCTLTGKNFCVLTKDYPMNEVRQAVERSFRSVRIMYEELQTVSDQELHKDDFNTTNNQAASGKFACQTQVEMMRPGWAKDEITKEWMLVVNTDVFPQRVRTESCALPNTPCEFIAPFYDSTCQQRYSLHRMIAIDPHDPSRSPQVAVFKFPAGCVCRVHPIRKTTTVSAQSTTNAPFTIISSSTSKSIRRR